MLFFFIFLLKNKCTKNPQLVITDTAPEILPLDDSITYNIKTDEKGVVTITTLDQDNKNISQQEISGSSNIRNNEDILRYAPTVEELNNSMSNPIINISENPQFSTELGVNPSDGQSSGGTQQSSGGTQQSNGSIQQSSGGTQQSSGGTVDPNNLPTNQLSSQGDVLLLSDPSSPQTVSNQPASTNPNNQNTDPANNSNQTQKSNKSTDKSKSKKDKKTKKRDTNNVDDESEIISNGFNYNQDTILLLLEILYIL